MSAGDGMPQLLFRNYHDGTATFVSGGTSKRDVDGLYMDEYVRYLSDPYFSVRALAFSQNFTGLITSRYLTLTEAHSTCTGVRCGIRSSGAKLSKSTFSNARNFNQQ